ncbi:carbon-nitrogen family hydrolase [Macrococcus brunensis]|uniref:carbon-nitrogen family hydrolase n=1 Tax=Macrococcus brunensis TaxID=198483 RepID=UPI001EF02AA2|nr:carbon-nitrogen family hydrolase [Macrococcus brunensis]ULG73849.1 carbon-nitrogen family hydrolase [Macrococcus brunensis]
MRIALYQMAVVPGRPDLAAEKVASWLRGLEGIDIAVLPEMWNTSYELERLGELADEKGRREIDFLKGLAQEKGIHIVGGSIAVSEEEKHFNRSVIVNKQGEVAYQYDKIHLVPMLDEPRYLTAGGQFEVFELAGEKMGVIICYDLRFPELTRRLALEGAEIIYVVAEWPEERMDHFIALLKARAIENQCYIAACNAAGECNGTVFGGQSMIIEPTGQVLAAAGQKEETIIADIDIERSKEIRQAIPVFESRRSELY